MALFLKKKFSQSLVCRVVEQKITKNSLWGTYLRTKVINFIFQKVFQKLIYYYIISIKTISKSTSQDRDKIFDHFSNPILGKALCYSTHHTRAKRNRKPDDQDDGETEQFVLTQWKQRSVVNRIKHSRIVIHDCRVTLTRKLQILRLYSHNL